MTDDEAPRQPAPKKDKPKRSDVLSYVADFHKGKGQVRDQHKSKVPIFRRGEDRKVSGGIDKKMNRKMKKLREKTEDAAYRAAQAELLLPDEAGFLEPEGPMEKTYKVTQRDVADAVDLQTSNKVGSIIL